MSRERKVTMRIDTVEEQGLRSYLGPLFDEQTVEVFGELIDEKKDTISLGSLGVFDGTRLVGGIIGIKKYQSLHVSLLGINKKYRSLQLGSKLLSEMERIGLSQGVIRITLTTKGYQALAFYKERGYVVYGELEDMPMEGVTKYYLSKKIS